MVLDPVQLKATRNLTETMGRPGAGVLDAAQGNQIQFNNKTMQTSTVAPGVSGNLTRIMSRNGFAADGNGAIGAEVRLPESGGGEPVIVGRIISGYRHVSKMAGEGDGKGLLAYTMAMVQRSVDAPERSLGSWDTVAVNAGAKGLNTFYPVDDETMKAVVSGKQLAAMGAKLAEQVERGDPSQAELKGIALQLATLAKAIQDRNPDETHPKGLEGILRTAGIVAGRLDQANVPEGFKAVFYPS